MNVRRLLAGGLLLAAGALSGCVVEVDFDPIGSHAKLSATWTVNGVAASQTNPDQLRLACESAGIGFVGLTFYDGSRTYGDYTQFRFPCKDGAYMSAAEVLGNGNYSVQWTAYNASGAMLQVIGNRFNINTTALAVGSTVQLQPVDFTITGGTPGFSPLGSDVSILAEWMVNGKSMPTAVDCSSAGIDKVRLVFYENNVMYDYGALTFPCAGGKYDSRMDPQFASTMGKLIRHGSFQTRWEALDVSGTEIAMGEMETLIVEGTVGHTVLRPINFVVTPPRSDGQMQVALTWEDDAHDTGDCNFAKAMQMYFELRDANGVVVADSSSISGATAEGRISCDEAVAVTGLRAGRYTLHVEGYDMMMKHWQVDCTDFDLDFAVDTSGIVMYDCTVPYL